MMTNTLPETAAYWNLIKDVKDEVKIRLIMLLSKSLANSARHVDSGMDETDSFIKKFYGAWKGPETAEEIIATINEGKSCGDPVQFF